MALPTVSFSVVDDDWTLWLGLMVHKAYVPSISTSGVYPYRARREGWRNNFGFWPTTYGKPSVLLRNPAWERTELVDGQPAVVHGTAIVPPVSSIISPPFYPRRILNETPPPGFGEFTIFTFDYIEHTALASVDGISTYLDQAIHYNVEDVNSVYYDNGRALSFPTHAFPITGGAPGWYSASPTHFIICPTSSYCDYGFYADTGAAAGWHIIPNDPSGPQSNRTMEGRYVEASPCGNGNIYAPADHKHIYVHPWTPGGGSWNSRVSVAINYEQLFPSPVVDGSFSVPLHTGIASITVDIRLLATDPTGPDGYDLEIVGFFSPNTAEATEVVLATISFGAYTLIDYTGSISIPLNGGPAHACAVSVRVKYQGSPFEYGGVTILAPTSLPACNPPQTTEWPSVVPGWAKKVALP